MRFTPKKKFRDIFSFENRAKLIFSTNMPPKINDEDSLAFWRRWIIIPFPSQFLGDHADKRLLEKLTTEQELSGLLNLAVNGLKRLRENGDFSYGSSPDEVADIYRRASDPIYSFVTEACTLNPSGWTHNEQLYDAYKCYCHKTNTPIMEKGSFVRALKNSKFNLLPSRRAIDGHGKRHGLGGITVNTAVHQQDNEYQEVLEAPDIQDDFGDAADNIDVEEILGMSVADTLATWRSKGAPIIHLGPRENCEDLNILLSGSSYPRHLQVVREWLEAVS